MKNRKKKHHLSGVVILLICLSLVVGYLGGLFTVYLMVNSDQFLGNSLIEPIQSSTSKFFMENLFYVFRESIESQNDDDERYKDGFTDPEDIADPMQDYLEKLDQESREEEENREETDHEGGPPPPTFWQKFFGNFF